MEAVKKNGIALEYVKEQTSEICMEAVKQNGYGIRICKRNKLQKYVWKQLKKMVWHYNM